jgi:dihydrolipoamide dehydrogenase
MSDMNFDLVVIGTGPGGYVGAIRAAQLGLKTAVIEKEKTFGGTCLNVGCIPSKALLESSEHFSMSQHELSEHGINVGSVQLDLKKMMSRKDKVVSQNTQGIAFLFKKNKITTFQGHGRIKAAGQVEVKMNDGSTQILQAKNTMIATGSAPAELPFLKFDEKKIISSTGALALSEVPARLGVIGGGVIGLELGSVWSKLGSKVTVIEYSDRLGGGMDQDCTNVLKKIMEKEGVKFLTSTKVFAARTDKKEIELDYENLKDNSKSTMSFDVVLVATGRKPFTANLGCEDVGILRDQQGRIIVDHHYKTNIQGVYAIGDVIAGPMLAHKAEEEGVACAELMAGRAGHVNYETVPGVIYTHPEIASVGLTEEQAKAKGLSINIGKFPFMANGRARAMGSSSTEGFVKILADATTDRIVGAHIVGPKASELIGEIVVAMEFSASSEDLARSFHAHPTLSEVIREAALAVDKRARQM